MPHLEKTTKRTPAFFVGHGSPMNAIEDNAFSQSLHTLGKSIDKPKAILIISAHWQTADTRVSVHKDDRLMYDMYGFPPALYEVKYPTPNADFLLPTLKEMLPKLTVEERSLDHGVWSVLVHLFPNADIPVMQLSINSTFSMQEHFEMGRCIRELREEGIMIIGSGNITHNLGNISPEKDAPVLSWAKDFDNFVKNAILTKDYNKLINFQSTEPYAKQAHPTIEHYLPLLYIAGSAYEDDKNTFVYEGFEHASLSMRNWILR